MKGVNKMGSYKYDVAMYRDHPVKIVHQYPTEEEVYFECRNCRTRYAVSEHYVRTYKIPGTREYRSDVHNCPKCGGLLVERTGKYGIFIGCSNYPKCKYTEKK